MDRHQLLALTLWRLHARRSGGVLGESLSDPMCPFPGPRPYPELHHPSRDSESSWPEPTPTHVESPANPSPNKAPFLQNYAPHPYVFTPLFLTSVCLAACLSFKAQLTGPEGAVAAGGVNTGSAERSVHAAGRLWAKFTGMNSLKPHKSSEMGPGVCSGAPSPEQRSQAVFMPWPPAHSTPSSALTVLLAGTAASLLRTSPP